MVAIRQHPEYKLAMLVGEATGLLAWQPRNRHLVNAACIVRGYCELYSYYEPQEFPWDQVRGLLARMRRGIRAGYFTQAQLQRPILNARGKASRAATKKVAGSNSPAAA